MIAQKTTRKLLKHKKGREKLRNDTFVQSLFKVPEEPTTIETL